jgi:thiol-disulfide isomerase/thioredoxin
MATEATVETISELVKEGHVLIDFWGPDCAPCMVMMPAVEALEEKYVGRITLLKVKAPDNRQVCRDMRVAGLPTYITLRTAARSSASRQRRHDRRHRGRDPAAPGGRAGDRTAGSRASPLTDTRNGRR